MLQSLHLLCFSFENLYAPNLYAPNNNAAIMAKPMITNKFFLLSLVLSRFVILYMKQQCYQRLLLLYSHTQDKSSNGLQHSFTCSTKLQRALLLFLANFIPANAATYVTIKLNKVKYINEFCIDNTVPHLFQINLLPFLKH